MTKPSDQFRTPPKLFKELDSVFNFFWDACCDENNCLADYQKSWFKKIPDFCKEYDYLTYTFSETVKQYAPSSTIFMNPPYSNPLPFIKKAWEDSKHFRVVMLLKADMSTKWFNYAIEQNENRVTHINQGNLDLKTACEVLLGHMKHARSDEIENPWREEEQGDRLFAGKIGILHLRKRIKFYVSEEAFIEDSKYYCKLSSGKEYIRAYCKEFGGHILETKNYKRVEDGIVSKSTANFPSLIMIFDRRGDK